MVMVVKSVADSVIPGTRFGRLTALRLDGKDKSRGFWRHACMCDCGRKVVVATRDLLSGKRQSCRRHRPCSRWDEDVKVAGTEAWASQKLRCMRLISKKYGYAEPIGTVSSVLDLWSLCGGRCECCDQQCGSSLHLDHCHQTGLLRGFLCRSCNVALGLVKEDAGRLFSLACWITSKS
jgi:hypothetical protein